MAIADDLVPVLKKLRLSGVLQTLDLRTRQAVEDDLSHSEFLFRLCSDEVERRDSKQLDARLRRAAFERWLAGCAARHGVLPASLRSASSDASFRRYFRIDRAAASGGGSLVGNMSDISRPTMRLAICWRLKDAVSPRLTKRPSRMTTTSSVICLTSSSLWEM